MASIIDSRDWRGASARTLPSIPILNTKRPYQEISSSTKPLMRWEYDRISNLYFKKKKK